MNIILFIPELIVIIANRFSLESIFI